MRAGLSDMTWPLQEVRELALWDIARPLEWAVWPPQETARLGRLVQNVRGDAVRVP